jgi:hypothetical protein
MPVASVDERMLFSSSCMNSDSNCLAASRTAPLGSVRGTAAQRGQRLGVDGPACDGSGERRQLLPSDHLDLGVQRAGAFMACRIASRSCGVAPSALSAFTTSASLAPAGS